MTIRRMLCSLLLAAPLLTQNIVYHDDPSPVAGNGNSFPFGAETVRIQQLVPQAVLGAMPQLIQDLYVNPLVSNAQGLTVTQVYYGDIEIRMGLTQLTTLTTNWQVNSPAPTTVYRGPLLVRFEKNTWIPLGLPATYVWNPTTPADNLVVDFIVWDVLDTGAVIPSASGYFMDVRRSATSSISRAYRLGWTTGQQATSVGVDGSGIKLGLLINDGNFVVHDGECAGSNGLVPKVGALTGTWPRPGQAFAMTIANGPPNSVAAIVLGFERSAYLGVALPFDMHPLGAPSCTFWHGWESFLLVAGLNAAGAGSGTLLFPPGVPATTRLYGTWLCLDPAANALGLVPSGFLGMTL